MSMRDFIDRNFPAVAVHFRQIRDRRHIHALPIYQVPLGYTMKGGEGMAQARIDSGEIGMVLDLLDHADLFIDIGANYGVFTLAARNHGKRTIAVEPNLQNYEILLENLQRNKFGDVEAHMLAMGGVQDVLPLFGGGEGASLRHNWGGMLNTYSRLVSVNTIDTLIGSRFVGDRLVIKIDVEGHEYSVLQGALKTLTRTPAPVWLLEHGFHENFGGKTNPHFLDVFNLFWQNGYKCQVADGEKQPVKTDDVERWLSTHQRDFGSLNYLFSK